MSLLLDVSTLQNVLLSHDLREHELIRFLKRLNEIFTKERKSLESYPESRELVSAYTLFYMATNIPKLSFVLNKLSPSLLEKMKASTFIDIGTGPGTYLWAWKDYFSETGALYGIDKSLLMLEQARVCADRLFPQKVSATLSPSLPPLGNYPKTLFFGHSLDEMGIVEGKKLIEKVDPQYLIILGPGTSDFFKMLLPLRTELLTNGYTLHYPCPHQSLCPLQEKEDWCHQIFHATHDPSLERLSQLIERDRRTMPLIAHVYAKKEMPEPVSGTVIRFFGETKFSFEFQVCLKSGEEKKIEVLKKDLDKEMIKKLKHSDTGEKLNFEITKELSPERLRVKLIFS